MTRDRDFEVLMARLRTGDEESAAEVYRRFVHRLIGLARRQFESWARPAADHEDVVQSVFGSFFARHRQGQFDLKDWEALWGLLVLITLRKCGKRRRFLRARRRDVARSFEPSPTHGGFPEACNALDREPTPEEASVLSETLQQWLRDLDPSERPVVELILQGVDPLEIAQTLQRSVRTVRRVRQNAEARLQRLSMEWTR